MRVLLCAWRFDARGGCRKYAAACLTALQHGQRCGACRDGTRCELWHACRAATDVWCALVCVGVRVLLCAWRSDACGATLAAAADRTPPPVSIECHTALISIAAALTTTKRHASHSLLDPLYAYTWMRVFAVVRVAFCRMMIAVRMLPCPIVAGRVL